MKSVFGFILTGAVLGFLLHAYFFQPDPETVIRTETEIVRDTTEVEKIVYRQLPAKLDTVFVHDVIVDESESDIAVEVASMDTVLKDYGELHVDYLFPPLNYFDLEFDPFPRISETIVQTKIVQVPKTLKIYETQKAGFVGGVIFTSLIVYLLK